jgi:hypothetical protein
MLSRYFYKLAKASEKKQEEERFYRETLLSSVQNIDRSLRSEEPVEVSPVEALLLANSELIEKRRVQDAIEQELGVKM